MNDLAVIWLYLVSVSAIISVLVIVAVWFVSLMGWVLGIIVYAAFLFTVYAVLMVNG